VPGITAATPRRKLVQIQKRNKTIQRYGTPQRRILPSTIIIIIIIILKLRDFHKNLNSK
jgi:hypothetical protein